MHAKIKVVAAVGILMGNYALADVATVGQLSAIQGETIIKQAELKRAQAVDALSKLNVSSQPSSFAIGASAPAEGPQQSAPYVLGAAGAYGRLIASFMYRDGMKVDAAAGREIPGGYKVVKITPEEVVLSKDGKPLRLTYGVPDAQSAPANPSAGLPGASALPGMPGLPGGMGGSPSTVQPALWKK